ncbi:MAG: HD domain-containing protein [Oscillospiraceae bacterium]|nr:HD domain-containing protein [Oscillospiraceae bacterium]
MSQELKEEFLDIYKTNITREGADKLLEYLLSNQSDFFTAPASTKFHGAYEGGLLEHSLNVYHCLKDYLSRERAKSVYNMNYSEETIAVTALLHDICKVNFYKVGTKNVKNENGKWEPVPYYYVDDQLPYGHGEKSVYIITGFMRLSREEAFAIRYHMGFSANDPPNQVGSAFEMFPLAFALSTADMEATYFLEGKEG